MKVLDEFVIQTTVNETLIVEKRINILLRDKPKWLPRTIWYKILKRVLLIESKG